MTTFIVSRPVHYVNVAIKADTPKDAFELVLQGNGEEVSIEYSHTNEVPSR